MDEHTNVQEEESFSTDELVSLNEDKIDALINLLIKKNVISEEELNGEIEDLYQDREDGGHVHGPNCHHG
jgi:hypothetical protein